MYISLGILPSLIWLSYYLAKDLHPEPKAMILRIFLWGAVITIPVFFVQIGLKSLMNTISVSPLVGSLIEWFIIISFTEEFFKYLVIRIKVINSSNLDEPVDIMLYMVVAALGFAAVENVLYLLMPAGQMSFEQLVNRTLLICLVRFVAAIFLHTLCSAVIGYFLAISFCKVHIRKIAVISGILIATALHGLYDFSIMTLEGNIRYIIPALIILTLAFLVFAGFDRLKKFKSVCEVK